MTTATLNDDAALAIDDLIDSLRRYLDEIETPRLGDGAWRERIRTAGSDLKARLAALGPALRERQSELQAAVERVGVQLDAYSDALAAHPDVAVVRGRLADLHRGYEELLLELKARRVARAAALASSRQLKPRNYARNAFHAMNGIVAAVMYELVLSREQAMWVLGSILAVFGTLEITRRFSDRWNDFLVDKLFGAISRPSERYRVNSATIYLIALILIVAVFPREAVGAAVLILGLGDPAASIIGKRWGRRKLFRDKSLAGSLGFAGVSFAAVAVYFTLADAVAGTAATLGVAAVLAVVGAVTELLSSRIDDNFSIPVVCAAVAALFV
jgi:dolichol kinase